MRQFSRIVALTAVAGLLAVSPLTATILKHMNLEELAGNADKIFTGRVIDANKATVTIGGADLPTVTYTVMVETPFQGTFPPVKEEPIVNIQMIHSGAPARSGDLVHRSPLPATPDIQIGQRYVFFTTAPSAAGLSTTVGLGQGRFHIIGEPGDELAVNEYDNIGLFDRMNVSWAGQGPISYRTLTEQITSAVVPKRRMVR